jgi:hypothetical protein
MTNLIWPSMQIAKSSKIWHSVPPKNASPAAYAEWKKEAQYNKRLMLGLIVEERREKKVDKNKEKQ